MEQHQHNTFAPRILMSGGGTGGHIFPAIAIAQEIKKRYPKAEFLFIGALGKMEMEKVPQAGFKIEGLNITGFDRSSLIKNVGLPFKLVSSLWKARKMIKAFNPDVAIGTGGFASGPALFVASMLGVPIMVQEQNSLPGKTNQFLAKKAKAVFTAYPDMASYFGGTDTLFLGNPIRENIITDNIDTKVAKQQLGLNPEKLTVLSVGGSLGSRTLNNAWKKHATKLLDRGIQLIWQTGKTDYQAITTSELGQSLAQDKGIQIKEFISDMSLAYAAADIIVSRAGAIAVSELAVVGKPIVLVPFPFAAEDHQTKNAQALVEKNAARMVKDSEMEDKFWATLMEICTQPELRTTLSQNLLSFAKPKATQAIVDEIETRILKPLNQ